MGKRQREFRTLFTEDFKVRFGDAAWLGGQLKANMVAPPGARHLRRDGQVKSSEKIELGDLRAAFRGVYIMVEYESGGASPYNILKHWPYLRGELDIKPNRPTLLCCFCDWWSYGAIRDICNWLITMVENDPLCGVKVRLFDHAFRTGDAARRDAAIQAALNWVDDETANVSLKPAFEAGNIQLATRVST